MSRRTSIRLPTPQDLSIQMKLEGGWTQLDVLAANLQQATMEGYDKGISIIGKKVLYIVKRAIATGIPPGGVQWPPLAMSTIRAHGDHLTYYLTGLFFRAMTLKQRRGRTFIGMPYNMSRPGAGITMNQLAIILEHGNDRIPARPLWKPSYKQFGGNKEASKLLLKCIRQALYKHGIRANQIK